MSELGFHGHLPLEAYRRKTAMPKPHLVRRYLQRFDVREVTLWAFRGLLIGAIAVLVLDLREVSASHGLLPNLSWLPGHADTTVLPPARSKSAVQTDDPGEHVTTDDALLDGDMRFTLGDNGELALTGRIVQGSADAFAEEVNVRGDAVKTVVIDSPGGSLEDAMAMARLIREHGFATEVRNGALCASSCPLLFSGGVTRKTGQDAAIGLHQFYAAPGGPSDAAAALSSAQATAAKISRFLSEMGVDAALWLHALDTPPQSLYYLTPQERTDYRLVTAQASVAAVKS